VSKRDYYEVLGVGRSANDAELKSAYRKLAMKYHPDRNPGDKVAEDRFKEAAEAYAVLADGEKRSLYDRFGHAGVSSATGGGGGFDPSVFAEFGDFADILGNMFGFGDLFGGGGAAPKRRFRFRGRNSVKPVSVPALLRARRRRRAVCAAASDRSGASKGSSRSLRRARSAAATARSSASRVRRATAPDA